MSISRGRQRAKDVVRDVLHETYCDRPSDTYSDDCAQGCGSSTQEAVAALVKARLLILHPEPANV